MYLHPLGWLRRKKMITKDEAQKWIDENKDRYYTLGIYLKKMQKIVNGD